MKLKFWKNFLIIIAVLGIFFAILVITAPRGRPKSPTAFVKANLANIRVQAQIVHDAATPTSYQFVCTDELIQKMLEDAKKDSISVKCFDDSDSFVAAAEFKKPTANNTHWCVDSSGASKLINNEQYTWITTSDTLCP